MRCSRNIGVDYLAALALVAVELVCFSGCADQGISGGTLGHLLAGDVPLGQMQVTVHEPEVFTPVAIGFTDSDGAFHLVAPDASRPIVLSSGTYRWTVQSVGAEVEIPKMFMRPERSHLTAVWDEQGTVTLTLPTLKKLKVTR